MANRAPPAIFSGQRRTARAARAVHRQQTGGAARFVLDEIAEDIAERLAFMRFDPKCVLVLSDITEGLSTRLADGGADVTVLPIGRLAEEEPYPNIGYDLIVSINALDTVNDLPGALIQMRNALADGGIAIAAFPSAGSLPMLRSAMLSADDDRPAARIHPMVDARSGAALMQRAGFARQVADSYSVSASYRSLDTLISDLRDQGLTGVLASAAPSLSKAALQTARRCFLDQANEQNKVVENFEILTLTGWKS